MSESKTFNDVLIECVKAAGGSKVAGAALFPEKPMDTAQRLLLACLNEDRPEKLSPDQALFIMRMAKGKGFHGVNLLCDELGYSHPVPVEPKDEIAELQRQFIEASKHISAMAERIEKLSGQVK